jgi:O-antigen/teichoic acid export membrane protein
VALSADREPLREVIGSIARQSTVALFYRCAGAAVTFAFGVTFARIMPIEEFGVLMSLMSFGLVAATIALIGQQTLLLREVPKLVVRKDYQSIAALASRGLVIVLFGSLLVSAIAAIVFVIGHHRWAVFAQWQYATGLLLVLPWALVELQSNVGRALGSINLAIVPKDVLWRLLVTAVGLLIFVSTGQPVSASQVFLIATFTLALLIVGQQFCLRQLLEWNPFFSIEALGRERPTAALSASLPFWITSVANVTFPTMDVVVVAAVVGPESAAYYYAANRFAVLLDFFMSAFAIPAARHISHLYHAGFRSEVTEVTSSEALCSFIAVLLGLIVLVVCGDKLLLLFGTQFVRSQGIALLLAAGTAGGSYLGVGTLALEMTGHQRIAMQIMIVTSLLGLLTMIAMASAFGAWGAAIAAACSPLAMKAAMATYLYRVDGIDLTASTKLSELAVRLVGQIARLLAGSETDSGLQKSPRDNMSGSA